MSNEQRDSDLKTRTIDAAAVESIASRMTRGVDLEETGRLALADRVLAALGFVRDTERER